MVTPYEVFWLFGIPAAVFSWYHIARHAFTFVPAEPELPHNPHPRIVFSIAARRLAPIVKTSVDSINASCSEAGFTNYEVKVVVDEMGSGPIEGVETILVPPDFVSQSRFKARALHYALGFLPNDKNVWILHLDEDARVTPQCVKAVVHYIENGGKPIANGPSVFPYDGDVFTFLAEAQRHWTFYWLKDQLNTSAVHWLNGSNLLIRSDVEHQVGWDFPNCFISEDSRFGYEATKKLGRVFGWHGGVTIETPPATVRGVLKQRMRWFYGSILNLRYVPRARLPRRIYSITVWMNGLLLTVFFFVLILGVYHEPWFSHLFILHGFTVTSVFWLGRYQIGIYQNTRFGSLSPVKRVLLHLAGIPLTPVIDLICTLPTVLGLIIRPRSFQITAKRA